MTMRVDALTLSFADLLAPLDFRTDTELVLETIMDDGALSATTRTRATV
jgi:hypothetical protein